MTEAERTQVLHLEVGPASDRHDQADESNPLSHLAYLSDPNVYLGRQPIYSASREIRAYEVLYRRSAAATSAEVADGDRASAEVLLKAFLDIGLARVSPERPAFINYPAALLAGSPMIPPELCVIEILEDVAPDRRNLGNVRALKRHGYSIALDDFVAGEARDSFLPLADYVKLDVRALAPEEFRRQVEMVRKYPVSVVAEKVESEEEFQRCRDWGCELFQGYYLRKPELVKGWRVPSNQLSVMALLTRLTEAETSATSVGAAIARDVTLTYGILKLANSALHGTTSQIRSPVHAVERLGMDQVFRWTTLLALAGNNDCPRGYLEFALQRGRMAELLASSLGCREHEAYITGLLSPLDSICGAPAQDILEPLPIDSRVKGAILRHEGPLGAVLDAVLGYEACREDFTARHRIRMETAQRAFWEAADYAARMLEGLPAQNPGNS